MRQMGSWLKGLNGLKPGYLRRGAPLLVALAATACGEFSSDTSERIPLVSVPVRVLNEEATPLRLALVWEYPFTYVDTEGGVHPGHTRVLGADQPLQSKHAPGPYVLTSLELHDVPPLFKPLAREFLDHDFRMAHGYLLAYEDLNGNGQLDLLNRDAEAYVDRIVAESEQRIVYVRAADLEDPYYASYKSALHETLREGFGIYTPAPPAFNFLGSAIHERERDFLWDLPSVSAMQTYLPMSIFRDARHYYELKPLAEFGTTPDDKRKLQTLACAVDPVEVEHVAWRHGPAPHEQAPLPIEKISCPSDYSSSSYYWYKGCDFVVPEGPCRGEELRCWVGNYSEAGTLGLNRPPNWPCPCDGCPTIPNW